MEVGSAFSEREKVGNTGRIDQLRYTMKSIIVQYIFSISIVDLVPVRLGLHKMRPCKERNTIQREGKLKCVLCVIVE